MNKPILNVEDLHAVNKENVKNNNAEALSKITKDRARTNVLKKYEQNLIAFLVQRVPRRITSDMLTALGFLGTLLVMASFILARFVNPLWLLLNIPGFMISWMGDSLDGRLAYYRNIPRKWYGFTLDLIVDWIGTVCIGIGFMIYVDPQWKLIGAGFVFLYGWSMMIALLRYKITNKYSIDSGFLGPTEVRIIISLILLMEVIFRGSIVYLGIGACVVLLIVNSIDFIKLLKTADLQDKKDKENKSFSF